MERYRYIGKNIPRIDSLDKVTGQALYGHDLSLPHMLYGKILYSQFPHAKVLHIDTSRAKRLIGVKYVITADDTPMIRFGFVKDNLPLKKDKVRSIRDEVAAVAATDEEIAQEALGLIKVDYEELPALFDPEEAIKPEAPLIHEGAKDNKTPISYHYTHGDIEKGMGEAHEVVENTFRLPFVTHCCLETSFCLASFDLSGNLTFWNNTQIPHLLQKDLADALGLPGSKIRVIQPAIGGAFGSKLDTYPFQPICCFLAQKTGKPVKIEFSREEEFRASPTRQPALIQLKGGVKKDGTLAFRDFNLLLDVGAYVSWGATTPFIMLRTVSSLYKVPHVRFSAATAYTNNLYSGAMRGFGNPQATFAIESQMDILAEAIGMDSVEFRLKNANNPWEETPQGLKVTTCGLTDCIKKVAEEIKWKEKRGKKPTLSMVEGKEGKVVRGAGISSLIHCGGGARIYRSDGCGSILKMDDFGLATLITGASEIGQGSNTVLTQIVAEEMGVPLENVRIINGDTSISPWDVGSHASRTTFVAGNSARIAARQALKEILLGASEILEANPEDLEIQDGIISVKGSPEKSISIDKVLKRMHHKSHGQIVMTKAFYDPPTVMEDRQYFGNISATYSFGAQAVEVEVDCDTGEVRVLQIIAAHDVGKVINLRGLEGQVEGGAAMGLGYALSEQLIFQDGKLANDNFMDYKLMKAPDMPLIKTEWVETEDPEGPFGAKGVGEVGAICAASAVANAIYDALGIRIYDLPITAEKVLGIINPYLDP